ncbi:hypothetical protein [Colwellia psychrerythraea]|uniref:Uncharacterized protein n=1 Tax=Colwellia psychrerythraea (strain 34H / ATCC BAA-681) TaxID=167879 RepID=Q489K9_COLP3|nr:hypothetical protein [Colwellia psychrerythraea]AAZ28333.1 hypothetical protein CPS_0497 [Colwellia psychrerythraea 34H]
MKNLKLIKDISEKLASENDYNLVKNNWILKEVDILVDIDPRFEDLFEKAKCFKPSVLSDYINDSFKEELLFYSRDKKNPPQLQILRNVKDCCELPDFNLYHYLKAGFSVKEALLHCYNHRYVKHKFIRWDKDITAGIEYLISENMVLCDCLKKHSNGNREKKNRTGSTKMQTLKPKPNFLI